MADPAAARTVEQTALTLRRHATHHVISDWDYTRLTDIQHIRYAGDFAGYYRLDRRARRAAKTAARVLLGREPMFRAIPGPTAPLPAAWHRVVMAWACIRVETRTATHEPDGTLDGGAIITHWEEAGEYLQLVQPSVGVLLADFLAAEPDHPHARMIAAEIERIRDRYTARIRAGEVDGQQRPAEGEDT